jgi:DNA-binding transcriptional LysR family regulator
MQRLPLSALRAFAAVYEAGGVRSAARALQVTHSSVSRHLHELEAWLGVALLEKRSAKEQLAFTPQGKALGEAALAGIEALTNAVDSVREVRRANSVVIATTASFAVRWLLPRLAALRKSQTWIEVSVTTQQAVQNLSAQGADLAVRMGSGPWFDESANRSWMTSCIRWRRVVIGTASASANRDERWLRRTCCTIAIRRQHGSDGSQCIPCKGSTCGRARASPHRI